MNIEYLKKNMSKVFPPVQPILQANSTEYIQKLAKVNPVCLKSDDLFYQFSTGSADKCLIEIFPDCQNILFNCTGDNSFPQAFIYGGSNGYALRLSPNSIYFGVKLYCHLGIKGWKVSPSELYNNNFELKYVLETKHLEEKIAQADSFNERILLFTEHMISNWSDENYTTGLAEYIAMCLCVTHGNISIEKIAEFSGYSDRYCRKCFTRDYYISPKEYGKYVRFQKVMSMLLSKSTNVSEIVYENGYSDESHLINDFKSFTGLSPNQFRKKIQ